MARLVGWSRCTAVVLIFLLFLLFLTFDTPTIIRIGSSTTPTLDTTDISYHVTNTSAVAPRILLVSAFFPLSKSKHSDSAYNTLMRRFLGPFTTDVYFFTPPE